MLASISLFEPELVLRTKWIIMVPMIYSFAFSSPWANQQADRVDPFVSEKPVSVLDRKHELRGWWVCRKCAVRFGTVRAKVRLFNTASKVLPCGLG